MRLWVYDWYIFYFYACKDYAIQMANDMEVVKDTNSGISCLVEIHPWPIQLITITYWLTKYCVIRLRNDSLIKW